MADKQSHINQWKHNRKFISSIDPEFHDWIITAVFYTAVHAVDTLLAHDKVTVTDHEARNRALKLTNRYEQINLKYEALYGLARTIRYFANPTKWVAPERIYKDVVVRYLYPIEASVQKHMGQDLGLGDVKLKVGTKSGAGSSSTPT
ncbi:MAG TPA: hypothetical protein VLI90_09370 [Tepidisphaeraceae bacterium]|nr:hypothetical protein [Tepidisphaeraceae bacterium]